MFHWLRVARSELEKRAQRVITFITHPHVFTLSSFLCLPFFISPLLIFFNLVFFSIFTHL